MAKNPALDTWLPGVTLSAAAMRRIAHDLFAAFPPSAGDLSMTPRKLPRQRMIASAILSLGLSGLAGTALAHHSFAMFDPKSVVTLTGTVREFQFTNPHCWIQLLVPNKTGGGTTEWSIEMAAPAHLVDAGWTKRTVKPGDQIIVKIRPLRSGGKGGSFLSATDQNGRPLGKAGAAVS